MLVVRGRLTSLGGQVTAAGGEAFVVGDEHAATGGGDDLVAVEGEDGGFAERAGGSTTVGGSERLGGVLDDWDGRCLEERKQLVVVGALAVEVDDDGGSNMGPCPSPLFDGLGHQGR